MRTENHSGGGRSVVASLHFDRAGLSITKTPFGVVLKLDDLKSSGEPGTPALPHTQLRLAIPQPLWPDSLKIVKEKWEPVSEAATLVVPAQHLRAGSGGDAGLHCSAECSCRTQARPDRAPVAGGLPPPKFTPPNPDAYAVLIKNPPPVLQAVRIETIGSTRIAVVEVSPVRLGPKGEIELCTYVQLEVGTIEQPCMTDQNEAMAEFKKLYGKDFDKDRVVPQPERFISGLTEATWLRDIAVSHVINPAIIGRIRTDWPIIELRSDYLIITDDITWDATAITPGLPRPGIIAAFERLAQAKRARGISARVVSVTDIVGGRWGDVRTGSRDLQEVIRRFLKLVRRRWGVNWLLLGGDISIVPVREVAGPVLGAVKAPGTVNPPENKNSFWTGSHLRVHAADLGDDWTPSAQNQLFRQDTGVLIPYDSAGTSGSASPGWYFTTTDDYATRSATATEFVRVEGPSSLVNAALRFVYAANTIPTDFYYSSLSSWVILQRTVNAGIFSFTLPYVYTPPHDWDAVGNSIYGQANANGNDIDGVILQADLSVGRAPVEYAVEATAFVDKTLAYERLGRVLWRSADRSWPRKMLIAAADWADRVFFSQTANATPADYEYSHDAAQSRTLLKNRTVPSSFQYALISRITENDRRVLPLKTDTRSTVRGWYFAQSATDLSRSHVTLSFPFGRIDWPVPSAWMVIHGSLAERTPQLFEFNPTGQQQSMSDQEALRQQVRTDLPGVDTFDRYYEDEFDLSITERLAAPVDYLTVSKLTSGLNAAPHFVSLSGHGSRWGCCGLSTAVASGLTNGALGFVAYADSCSTNRFDSQDAMGEELLKNPNGGAVAYVGNTRFSWIGVGDNFQRGFFHRLTAVRNLGLLNDSRLAVVGTTGYWRPFDLWAVFALNLLGDPELRVYRGPLPPLILSPVVVRLRKPVIRIIVDRQLPIGPPTPGDPSPVKGVLVYVKQGKQEFMGRTDADGYVYLPEGKFEKGELEVTASHDEYALTTEVFQAEG